VRWSPATLHPSLLAGGQLEAAADQAVRSQAAALVAVRPSTGEVLAVADRLAEPKDAFQGLYPPGSTFKVITAADLLHGGMTPGTSVDCPAVTVAAQRTIHNDGDFVLDGGEGGRVAAPMAARFLAAAKS
jgi:cell division protein FtsI/penicillin-binding protein 2